MAGGHDVEGIRVAVVEAGGGWGDLAEGTFGVKSVGWSGGDAGRGGRAVWGGKRDEGRGESL